MLCVYRHNSRHAAWPTIILRFMEICWKTLALSPRNLNGWIKLNLLNNLDIKFSWIFIEMIIYRQCTLRVAYHSLLEPPLGVEALGFSLYSLFVNTALRSMLPNLSLVIEFLGNVFTKFIFENLSRMKHWRREELELPVTIKCSFVTNNQWKKNLYGRYRQLQLLPKQIRFQSYFIFPFSLNKYDLRILSSVLIEIFDLRGKELKYAK